MSWAWGKSQANEARSNLNYSENLGFEKKQRTLNLGISYLGTFGEQHAGNAFVTVLIVVTKILNKAPKERKGWIWLKIWGWSLSSLAR